ncbi:hypothetical protein TNCV_4482201 [Trichonephila clavipes]|nr:hypothetical protein TNCV_4482201 [Trichonephila clavipes]
MFYKGNAEVDMPLRCPRRHYEQLLVFEMGRMSYHTRRTRRANCLIGRIITGPCVFTNHRKVPGCMTSGIAAPITSAANDPTTQLECWYRVSLLTIHGHPLCHPNDSPAVRLQPHVLPLMSGIPGVIFQKDNARPPTARVSQMCLRHITTLL